MTQRGPRTSPDPRSAVLQRVLDGVEELLARADAHLVVDVVGVGLHRVAGDAQLVLDVPGPIQEDKRIGIHDYPLYNFGFAVSQPDETVKTIETGEPYEIHGAWLQTTNPLACMGADPQRLYKALNKLDFIVVVDLFKTPTIATLADVVLPAQTFCERNGIAFVSGAQRGSTINKVTQVGECKSDMQINLELGKRWNPEAWPWDNVDDMFTDMLKPTGMSFEELQKVADDVLREAYALGGQAVGGAPL